MQCSATYLVRDRSTRFNPAATRCTHRTGFAVHLRLVTMVLALACAAASAHGMPQFGGTDTTLAVRERSFCYRTYCVMYDSVSVCCSFGEMCLPLRDSTAIEPMSYAVEPVDVAIDNMSSVCRSRPFDLDPGTVLSLWRGLHLQQDAWIYHYTVHDTCSWILRLHDDRDGSVLATLDSVGYLPAQITQWGEYPDIFGIDNSERFSYGTLTYNIGAWAERGVDRAFVSVSVVIHGEGDRGCTIRDQTLEERISIQMQKKEE